MLELMRNPESPPPGSHSQGYDATLGPAARVALSLAAAAAAAFSGVAGSIADMASPRSSFTTLRPIPSKTALLSVLPYRSRRSNSLRSAPLLVAPLEAPLLLLPPTTPTWPSCTARAVESRRLTSSASTGTRPRKARPSRRAISSPPPLPKR